MCEGLAYLAMERDGGYYYYPFYDANKVGAAFEWYLPFWNRRFGFKVGLEFWVDSGSLQELNGYVLYGEDHPKRGRPPEFTEEEKSQFQRNIIEILQLASDWSDRTRDQQFFTLHYLEVGPDEAANNVLELPALKARLLPAVFIGKEKRAVSAVIQSVRAHCRGEAKRIGAEEFLKLCALLTLSVGRHYKSYRYNFRRPALKQFVDTIDPLPTFDEIYPKGQYKIPAANARCRVAEPLRHISEYYSRIPVDIRSDFDNSLFAYYTAKDLTDRRFFTVATVALIAALKTFRRPRKCPGEVQCSKCGTLQNFKHNEIGEAASMGEQLSSLFGLDPANEQSGKMRQTIKRTYERHRSAYVHDAVVRHGEFKDAGPRFECPGAHSPFSDQLVSHNDLSTLELLTRRALLQHMAQLSGLPFDPATFGFEPEKFEVKSTSQGTFTVPQGVIVGIRA